MYFVSWKGDPGRIISSFFVIVVLIFLCGGPSLGVEKRQIIKSEDILAKIKNREPVDYNSVIIEDNLYLCNLSPLGPVIVDSPINIINSEIKCDIYFNDSILNRAVCFENTKFDGINHFDGTMFREYANFGQSVFEGAASFRGAKFRGSANFWNSKFNSTAIFTKSQFQEGMVDFHRSEFQDLAIFNFANFGGYEINFENSIFGGTADFRQARFNGDAIFLGSSFKDDADFGGSQFNSSSNFLGSRFDKSLYFHKIRFKNLDINWDSIHYKLISDEPGYISLIRNFKDLGQFDDADNCYYEYREWKRNNRPLDWARLFDSLAWLTCGYGVRCIHPIFSGFLVIIAFGIYYDMRGIDSLVIRYLFKRKSFEDSTKELSEGLKKTFSFSAITLLSLPSEWHPYGKEEYSKFIKFHLFSAIVERLIGYGLMLLLIGTLTRLMVRY